MNQGKSGLKVWIVLLYGRNKENKYKVNTLAIHCDIKICLFQHIATIVIEQTKWGMKFSLLSSSVIAKSQK